MRAFDATGTWTTEIEYAPDVTRVATGFVNTYLIGDADGWVLVDSGLAGFAPIIRRAAEARYGSGARPAAIVLTHGHFDHAGNVERLARDWDVPVYAHPLELPFLTGRSDYPPADPTVGGAIACMSRVFSTRGHKLSVELRAVTADRIPQLPGWQWIHTPGHTPGHISLFRDVDGVLIAGDALTTMNMDSWVEQVRRTPELCRPPAPLTTDWQAARDSIQGLASLPLLAIGAGHGLPVAGAGLTAAARQFARTFLDPDHGRYVPAPAVAGPNGVEWVPPPVPDPFPRQAAGAALAIAGTWGIVAAMRRASAKRHAA